MAKLRINAKSVPILIEIDRHIKHCDIRGPFERFVDVAADPLDGAVLRDELSDLITRRLLRIVQYGFDDSLGRDPARSCDPRLCGTSWSVNPTKRLIRALWHDRISPPASANTSPSRARNRP